MGNFIPQTEGLQRFSMRQSSLWYWK